MSGVLLIAGHAHLISFALGGGAPVPKHGSYRISFDARSGKVPLSLLAVGQRNHVMYFTALPPPSPHDIYRGRQAELCRRGKKAQSA